MLAMRTPVHSGLLSNAWRWYMSEGFFFRIWQMLSNVVVIAASPAHERLWRTVSASLSAALLSRALGFAMAQYWPGA